MDWKWEGRKDAMIANKVRSGSMNVKVSGSWEREKKPSA
jgi:hypothetical protein